MALYVIGGAHSFVVITLRPINALGIAMAVPVTTGGMGSRATGLTVAIAGYDATGVAVCNQVRSFDLDARFRAGSVRCVETLDGATTNEIFSRVLSAIDPVEHECDAKRMRWSLSKQLVEILLRLGAL